MLVKMTKSMLDKKKIIIGNWKLNPRTKNKALQLVGDIISSINSSIDVCIIPPQLFIPLIANELRGTNIAVGSQNCHYESDGAYTGEVSIESLKEYNVEYVLCGHSERRVLFKETDLMINKKVKKVVEEGLIAVLCIGETLEENDLGLVNEVCSTQIKMGLHNIDNEEISRIIIAYEPVWAIGTGKVCEPEDAEKTIKNIRVTIEGLYGKDAARQMRIIYGGSVNTENIKTLMNKDIDGCLVGGASINAESFSKIINYR
jgi:triosephosphate isomerase